MTVYNNADSGPGSLRQAIIDSNGLGGTNTIIFSNVTGKITLINGQLTITTNVTIAGPGDALLTISANTSNRVFAITSGAVDIWGLTLADGRNAPGNVGGCISNSANLTITACTLSNSGTFLGNAIYNLFGSLTVRDSTIVSNRNLAGGGGAIYNDGTATIVNCAIYGNETHQGALLNSGGRSMVVTNCTIFGNIGAEFGGGIVNSGSLIVRSCTIVSNSANDYWSTGMGGGGVVSSAGTANIGNTIIANNISVTNHPDVFGTNFVSAGYNFVGKTNGSTGWGFVADQYGTVASPIDPKLGPFQNNGGRTPTLSPLPGSLTIDLGRSFGMATDQRGFIRPADFPSIFNAGGGDGSDIGAVELWPASPQLNIQSMGTNVLLCWSTNAPDFRLQGSKSNLPSVTWASVSGTRGVVGDQFCVTNAVSGTNRFYHLIFP